MNDPERTERRRCKRFPFREEILIDGTKLSTSTDISEGGLFVSAIQHFEEGSEVELTIPFAEEKITVRAQVKYCQQGIGLGMMFIDVTDEQRARIGELITSIAKSG